MAKKNVIFVEGRDDLHVVAHLLKFYGYEGRIYIEKQDGIDKLLKALRPALKRSPLKRIGIIVDANTSLEGRWRALRNILMASGTVSLADSPDTSGTIAVINQAYKTLRVGVWLMPDNQSPGILEDFVGSLVPTSDDLWDKAKLNVDEIPTPRFPPERRSKAYMHTWLAWQEQPGKPFGQAISARYLDPNAADAQQLIAWIRRLFEL